MGTEVGLRNSPWRGPRRGGLRLLALLICVPALSLAGGPMRPAFAQAPNGPSPAPTETAPSETAPASPAAMKPAPNPADAKPPTPEHIAKARHLILATGISRSFQIIIPEFMDQIGNTLTQARPDLVHDMSLVLEQLRPEFDRQSEEMIDQSARIYATLLSEKDIDAINAFFDSPAGKKYVGAQPLFLNQLVSGMQAWQQKISIIMMSRVREEMKKRGHEL